MKPYAEIEEIIQDLQAVAAKVYARQELSVPGGPLRAALGRVLRQLNDCETTLLDQVVAEGSA